MTNKPNIVLIMADQMGTHMANCYGNKDVIMPNIDFLAENGIILKNNYIQSPVCMPSRISIFTGKYPSACGMTRNGIPMRDDEITLPYTLKMAGYNTSAFGKLHFRNECISMNPIEGNKCEFDSESSYFGFETVRLTAEGFHGPYERYVKDKFPQYADIVLNQHNPVNMQINNVADGWILDAPKEAMQTYWIADKTIDYINQQDDKPFFTVCSFPDPHHPFCALREYYELYKDVKLEQRKTPFLNKEDVAKEVYNQYKSSNYSSYSEEEWEQIRKIAYAKITFIDDQIGRIIKAVKEKGFEDNTIFIFTTDHGEMLGEHNMLYKGAYHFDELLHTPFIFYSKSHFKACEILSLTQTLDLMPTILDLAGVDIPPQVQGESMLPLLKGEIANGHESILCEHHNTNTLITKEWKISVRIDGDTGMLFNRKKDPNEQKNLWNNKDYSEIKTELTTKLVAAMMSARENTWRMQGAY